MPPSNSKRTKKNTKVIITSRDRERMENEFYRKVEEYMGLQLFTLRDMEKSMITPDGFKITGIALQALRQVIEQKQQLLLRTA